MLRAPLLIGKDGVIYAFKAELPFAEEWVGGDVPASSVENVWSLLKRSVLGAQHHVSVKRPSVKLDELAWR